MHHAVGQRDRRGNASGGARAVVADRHAHRDALAWRAAGRGADVDHDVGQRRNWSRDCGGIVGRVGVRSGAGASCAVSDITSGRCNAGIDHQGQRLIDSQAGSRGADSTAHGGSGSSGLVGAGAY